MREHVDLRGRQLCTLNEVPHNNKVNLNQLLPEIKFESEKLSNANFLQL